MRVHSASRCSPMLDEHSSAAMYHPCASFPVYFPAFLPLLLFVTLVICVCVVGSHSAAWIRLPMHV